MILTSNYCHKHKSFAFGKEVVKPIQMMMIGGEEVCPRCGVEAETEKLKHVENKKHQSAKRLEKYNKLKHYSILTDRTILNATFDTYKVIEEEERKNKEMCLEVVEHFKQGKVFNIFLQGVQGAGKTHLAYSILKELNTSNLDVSCLFVSVEEMLRLIRDSFNNKESRYTEQYFVDLLSSVDYLALDDIGAETGAIDTNKTATDFVQRVLYAVTNSRQDKVTISTTNLSSDTLFNIYDKKLMSRLLKNPKYIIFKDTKDKRMIKIPF